MAPSPHPGTLLQRQYLIPRSISQNRLARELGVPPRRINEIVLGKRAISADTAVRLARYFGNDPLDWMRMQAEFDIARAAAILGTRIGDIRMSGAIDVTKQSAATMAIPSQRNNIRNRILR